MIYRGTLSKMKVKHNTPIQYNLLLKDDNIDINVFLNQEITLKYLGEIYCMNCGKKTQKSFGQGYCYSCFTSAPETEECVLRPELCRAHEGIARDMEFAKKHCLIEHYVYLAVSSNIKVGVTRNTQIPTRWIDQGASYAIKFAKTPNRFLAGVLEVALKESMSDKTNWRKMLANEIAEIDLVEEKYDIAERLPSDLQEYITDNDEVFSFQYPVIKYPEKIQSINLDKNPVCKGILKGIKGQYLIFENGNVINIRKYGGYLIELGINK